MNNNILHTDVASILVSEEQINELTARLGAQITEDYKDSKKFVLLCILKGSTLFFADLMRKIDIPCALEFMRVSSYKGTETTHQVTMLLDVEKTAINGADVIIVEDIIDSGNTLAHLKNYIASKGANSVKTCTLLDKPSRRVVNLTPDYVGAEIPDEFVIGYGLDYDEKYRNLPYVGILKREVYEK
ncbi:MAG: hypoxanthine phosphoribosyltransferase [Clostridia bacterium]|nr:hypoxanthine phosphoribosyltransferase [Clostridia bacterium]